MLYNRSLLVTYFICEVLVTQSCPTLCNAMDCRPLGSSVHGVSQARYWSGLPFPSPGDLSDPGICISCIAGRFFYIIVYISYIVYVYTHTHTHTHIYIYMSIPISQFILPLSPPVTICLVFISVTLFLLCKHISLYYILDSAYKRSHVSVFFCLTYVT